jgi:hypothetical protein
MWFYIGFAATAIMIFVHIVIFIIIITEKVVEEMDDYVKLENLYKKRRIDYRSCGVNPEMELKIEKLEKKLNL